MTAPTDHAGPKLEGQVPIEAGERPQVYLELPDIEPGKRRPRRSRWWRYGFPVALLLLVAAIPVLVYAGIQVVLKSNDGRLIPATTDASSPGWEASVPPTPTMVVATVNDSGGLSSVALLALTADKQGNVVLIPADTQVAVGTTRQTMVQAYVAGGQAGLKSAVEALTGTGIDQLIVVNGKNWQDLVSPAGDLRFDNPDNVIIDGAMLFPQGVVTVTPDKVGAFIESRNWAEDDTNRLLRQEQLWKAWMAKVAAAPGTSAVPGETDTGIGRFVDTLAREQVEYSVLPVQVHALTTAYAGVYLPLPEVRQLIGQVIPFPTATAPGLRPRIRVLDGTGRLGHGLAAAHNLADDGAQIDSIGNAGNFHQPHTEFIVSSESERAAAQKLRDAFGVGTVVVDTSADDSIDITVVLGADALKQPQAQSTILAPASSSGSATSSTVSAGG